MMRRTFGALLIVIAIAGLAAAQSRQLEIYWIDTEGGAATLVITPAGQSLLIDTGNLASDDRDAKRIFAATQAAGLKKLDYLLTTHYHSDHVGGAPALARMIPITHFYDHGDSVEAKDPRGAQLWEAYKTLSAGKRTVLKPGDKIPLKGLDITVLSSNGELINRPIKSANALCKDAAHKAADPSENARSVGILLTYGKFKFLDLGDLTWEKELLLACPSNQIGRVTLFQATHHGFAGDSSGPPPQVWAAEPQIVVVNNGATKGLSANAYEILSKIPGVEGIWQSHRAVRNDDAHNTAESMIANLEQAAADCKGQWLKATIAKNGNVTLTNQRNGFSKTYRAR